MKNKQLLSVFAILAIAALSWFGYKYFFRKKSNESAAATSIPVSNFLHNSCWVYHDYVYRVDFKNFDEAGPFLFIRNIDGTFSPSKADSAVNNLTGNGFLIDSLGGCLLTENLAEPWILSDEEQQPLKEIIDDWLKQRFDNAVELSGGVGFAIPDYTITGQTVALFVVMNNPKEFVEYYVPARMPGQNNYRIAYPDKKIELRGISSDFSFSNGSLVSGEGYFQVLKATFDESNNELPVVKQFIDSVHTDISGFTLTNLKAIKGDNFFNEGSMVFDTAGRIIGNLGFKKGEWSFYPLNTIFSATPVYSGNEPAEVWQFDINTSAWTRTRSEKNKYE